MKIECDNKNKENINLKQKINESDIKEKEIEKHINEINLIKNENESFKKSISENSKTIKSLENDISELLKWKTEIEKKIKY